MEAIIVLITAGFFVGFVINKTKTKNDYEYKNDILKSHIELLKDSDYRKTLQDTEDLKTKKF